MQNLTAQKVMLGLITLAFFIAAPWLTSETLSGNTTPLLSLLGVGLLLLFVYGLGDRCWMVIPFSLPIQGNLNFIPLNFSVQELAIMTVFTYILFRMIFGLNIKLKLGPAWLWFPLVCLLAVIAFHWIKSGDIGVKLLGGTGWGGRKYFQVFIASLSIPLLASFPGIRWTDLQKVPLIYFLGSFVDIVPGVVTTFVPSTAPLLFRFYSGVNVSEYGATLLGNFGAEAGVTRVVQFSQIGSAIGLVTLCYFPPRTWLRPDRLWTLPVLLLGGGLCALSGFRNTVVRYMMSTLVGMYATIRWKAFLILPLAVAAALIMAATQGTVFNYPLALQRGLSFLPGNWDAKAAKEAGASSDWRERMKELFYKEYFQKAPILGQGYHYDPSLAKTDADVYLSVIKRRAEAGDEYADVRNFIEQRMPHEGLVHAFLVSGVVGTFFFAIYCISLIFSAWNSVKRTPRSQMLPIQVWAFSLLFTGVFAFFALGGDYTSFLIQVCPISTLLFCSDRFKKANQMALKVPTGAPASESATNLAVQTAGPR